LPVDVILTVALGNALASWRGGLSLRRPSSCLEYETLVQVL
jgi:hypothetical protein